jgi:hypothetical protein
MHYTLDLKVLPLVHKGMKALHCAIIKAGPYEWEALLYMLILHRDI